MDRVDNDNAVSLLLVAVALLLLGGGQISGFAVCFFLLLVWMVKRQEKRERTPEGRRELARREAAKERDAAYLDKLHALADEAERARKGAGNARGAAQRQAARRRLYENTLANLADEAEAARLTADRRRCRADSRR